MFTPSPFQETRLRQKNSLLLYFFQYLRQKKERAMIKGLLQGIDTIIIRISDFDRSKKWYQEKLELSLLFEDASASLAVLDTGGPTSITLWQTKQEILINPDTASYPIFKTSDAGALRDELIQRKVEVKEILQDEYAKYFFFSDPDGNVLEACEILTD